MGLVTRRETAPEVDGPEDTGPVGEPPLSDSRSSRSRWRGVAAGTLLGSFLAVSVAMASHTVDAHTSYLWYHGMRVESNESDGHPFLDSTDGASRDAIAAFETCSGVHSTEARYIASHVHKDTDFFVGSIEAHLTSPQTGMSHHEHYRC
jgi:hypothetical protein